MSSCSFASYIQMRTAAFCSSPITSSSSPSSPSSASSSSGPTSVAASPTLVHLAPSPVPSADSASPHKRQRNKSPDHSSPALPSSAHDSPADSPTTPTLTKSGPKVDPLSYFFAAGSHAHPPTSGGAGAFGGTVPTHAAPSPVCPLRSILCTSHFDETGSLVSTSSPATSSPPISRPLSRRSSTSTSTSLSHSTSTSKSVRFARCTNASVFPTHSTADYDRSPIVPTCEAESLEIYRCPRGGSEGGEGEEGGGWIMCHAKKAGATEVEGGKKKKFVAAAKTGAAGSGSAGGSMMPVEGVRGLFAGSYFEGEERDHPLFPASTPACGSAGVVIPEMVDEEEDEDEGILGEGIGDDGELMEVDDSAEAEDVEATNAVEVEMDPHDEVVDAEVEAEVGAMELLAVSSTSSRRRGSDASAHSTATSSASSATSTEESSSHNPHRASSPSTPTSSPPAELANDEEREKDKAQRCAERKKRFGLIGLGKYTRQELFQSHDSLSGF